MDSTHNVRLSAYEGPLDMLLRLIERAEIDIYDIPIAELTDQYMEAVRDLPHDMENISEFIVMAATLLEIKSRMLLPRPPKAAGDEEDPREALVRRLLEHQVCQGIAAKLRGFPSPGQQLVRDADPALIDRFAIPGPGPVLTDVSLDDLWQLFSDAMLRQESRIDREHAGYGTMPRERFTVAATIARLRDYLRINGRFALSGVLNECINRGEMVVTFLALLEMVRQGLVRVKQDRLFKEIWCEPEQPAGDGVSDKG
jgi:segregation and condensation protein A